MADDVWAGIPVELREKVLAYVATWHEESMVNLAEGRRIESELTDALRSLVSRLREAEKDTERLNWMERQDWSANGVLLGKLPLRRSVDQALELERN